ncbi:hypothetical protein ABID20_004965, partial [Rhizobium alvei]
YTTGDQSNARVTALDDGGWLVTWQSKGQDGSSNGIYQQRFSKNGDKISDFAPEGANATVSLDEDTSYSFEKADFGFTDADGDKLESITITSLPSSGTLVLDGVAVEKNDVIAASDIRKLVWTPDANANGKGLDSLKFTVTDSYGTTSKSAYTITFDVDAVDDLTVYAETRVNSATAGNQTAAQVTTLSDGSYVVTWQSADQDGDGNGIYQQHYSAKGVKIGGEVQVNSYTVSEQLAPSITALSGGGWVVTWQSAGPDGSSYGIVQQRYDADGNADAAGEILVNTTATSAQRNPVVTALDDGGWVVAWESLHGGDMNIYQQRFTSGGVASDGETLVNGWVSGNQVASTITALKDGGWVVAWEGSGGNGSEYGIYQQRYNSAGTAVGSETLVNSTTAGDQGTPSITGLADGGWVVTWYDPNKDGDAFGIFQQRYNSSGATVGSETQVNTFVTGIQFEPSVTALKSGGWVVTWSSSDHDGGQYGVYQQLYNKNGAAVGDETRINTTTDADQDTPSVSALNDGGWVVTWSSYGQDGDGEGVYMQRFNSAGKTSFSSDPTGKNKTVTAKEDTDFSFAKSLITFSDNDGDTLSSIVITSLPTKGKLTFAGQAVQKNDVIAAADLDELVWTPPANANGKNVASIGFKVEDSSGNMSSSTYKLTMDVTAVNDAPTGADKTLTIKEDSGYKMNKSAFGFADIDGDSLGAVKISTLDGDGTLTFKGKEVALGASIAAKDLGQLVWKPLKDAFGTGVGDIGFKVVDDNGLASSKINHLIFNVTDVVDTITGKKGADTLIGTAGADTISGLAGNDKLDGRAGNDSLAGGTGKDTFIFTGKLNDADKIVDFDVNGGDVIDLSASKIKNFSDLMTTYAHDSGSDVVISFEAGGKVVSSLTIEGVSVAELKVDDFLI